MLRASQLCGFGSGGRSASPIGVELGGKAENTADLASYTFTGLAIGSPADDRHVVLEVWSSTAAMVAQIPSSVTVGGVPCTYINTMYPPSNPNNNIRTSVYISSAPVPGGATADVTVAFAGTATFCTVRAIALYGLKTPTPSANVVDLTGGDNSLTINVPQDGILATTTRWQTAGPYTWTGVASVLDAPARTVSTQNHYEDLAIEVPTVAATGRTIACADTTDDLTNHLMAIAWEGAGVPTGMIRFVGAAVTTSSGAMSLTSLTGGIGSAPQAGDLVIVAIAGNATSNIDVTLTTPSGYSEIADLYSSDTYDTNLGVFWKFMGASPDTSVTIPGISVPAAVAYVLRNVDPGTPFDAASTTTTGIDTAMGDPPSITTVTDNAMVVSVLGHSSNDGSATPPPGYSNVASVGNGSGNWEGAAIASKIKYAAGVENPAAWADIASTTGSSWAAVTIVLRPKS